MFVAIVIALGLHVISTGFAVTRGGQSRVFGNESPASAPEHSGLRSRHTGDGELSIAAADVLQH